MPTLKDAILLAEGAHRGQVDKQGKPYIGHLRRVARQMDAEQEKILAYLHDIVEDTSITFDDLRTLGYSEEILEALWHLTKLPKEREDYGGFIQRLMRGPELARRVKQADLKDNSDPARVVRRTRRDIRRQANYRRALRILQSTNK